MKTNELPERLEVGPDGWVWPTDNKDTDWAVRVAREDFGSELARRWNAHRSLVSKCSNMNAALKKIASLGIHSRPLSFAEIHRAIRTACDAADWETKEQQK